MRHLSRMKISKALQYRGDKHTGPLKQLVMKAKKIQKRNKQKSIKPRVSRIFDSAKEGRKGWIFHLSMFPSQNQVSAESRAWTKEAPVKVHVSILTALSSSSLLPHRVITWIQKQNMGFSALTTLCQCSWALSLSPAKCAQVYNV